MKTIVILVSLLLLLLHPGVDCGRRPPLFDDILKQCRVEDQDSLDRCLHHLLNSIRPYFPDGIPEWNIPVLEPLAIRTISLNQGGGNSKITATFRNLRVQGLSNYTITYVKSDPAKYTFSLGLQFPRLHITGKYEILGSLLLIPIKGLGPFWADFMDVAADSYNWLEVTRPETADGGRRHLNLTHTQTDFDIGKVKLRLEQLFNNDEFLGETVNTFLNENAEDIIREVRPQFAQEIDRLVKSVFSEAIASLPLDLWETLAADTPTTTQRDADKADKADEDVDKAGEDVDKADEDVDKAGEDVDKADEDIDKADEDVVKADEDVDKASTSTPSTTTPRKPSKDTKKKEKLSMKSSKP